MRSELAGSKKRSCWKQWPRLLCKQWLRQPTGAGLLTSQCYSPCSYRDSGEDGTAWSSIAQEASSGHPDSLAHQPDFLLRDLSWHFTNTADDFPFFRWDTFSLEQKITLWKKVDMNKPYGATKTAVLQTGVRAVYILYVSDESFWHFQLLTVYTQAIWSAIHLNQRVIWGPNHCLAIKVVTDLDRHRDSREQP